jgi:hypothetical protein
MRTLSRKQKIGRGIALGAVTLMLGCESVALLPRDDVSGRRYGDRRNDDRRDRYDARRDEVFGRVQDVDERRREIRLRTDDGRSSIVRYDSNTQVFDGNRDLRPEALRSGDEISVRLGRDIGGERYADAIRVVDRRGS